jgi:hypothetical protein
LTEHPHFVDSRKQIHSFPRFPIPEYLQRIF